MTARPNRRQTKAIQILLTPEEHAQFVELKGDGSMRALIVSRVLGNPVAARVARLEAAIEDIVAEVATLRASGLAGLL